MACVGPGRETTSCPNSFGMRTSTRPSSKSLSFYRYKIASDLFVPLALETTCSQPFAQKHCLTSAFCADLKIGGRGDTPLLGQDPSSSQSVSFVPALIPLLSPFVAPRAKLARASPLDSLLPKTRFAVPGRITASAKHCRGVTPLPLPHRQAPAPWRKPNGDFNRHTLFFS